MVFPGSAQKGKKRGESDIRRSGPLAVEIPVEGALFTGRVVVEGGVAKYGCLCKVGDVRGNQGKHNKVWVGVWG